MDDLIHIPITFSQLVQSILNLPLGQGLHKHNTVHEAACVIYALKDMQLRLNLSTYDWMCFGEDSAVYLLK